jgi:hypothetical protein
VDELKKARRRAALRELDDKLLRMAKEQPWKFHALIAALALAFITLIAVLGRLVQP